MKMVYAMLLSATLLVSPLHSAFRQESIEAGAKDLYDKYRVQVISFSNTVKKFSKLLRDGEKSLSKLFTTLQDRTFDGKEQLVELMVKLQGSADSAELTSQTLQKIWQ